MTIHLDENGRVQEGEAPEIMRNASDKFLEALRSMDRMYVAAKYSTDTKTDLRKIFSEADGHGIPVTSDKEWEEGMEIDVYDADLFKDRDVAGILSTPENKRARNLLRRLMDGPVSVSTVRGMMPANGSESSATKKALLAYGLATMYQDEKTDRLFLNITDHGLAIFCKLQEAEQKAAVLKIKKKEKKVMKKFPIQRVQRIVEQILKKFPTPKGKKMKIRGALAWWGLQLAEEMPHDVPDGEKEKILWENFSSVARHRYRDVEVMYCGAEEEASEEEK